MKNKKNINWQWNLYKLRKKYMLRNNMIFLKKLFKLFKELINLKLEKKINKTKYKEKLMQR